MQIKCSYTELVDIDLLVSNPRNPNKHPEEQIKLLAKIMKYQGWRSPIVVSARSGFIVKGHGRLMAAKLNGWDKAPVDKQEYASEAEEYADMVADNKIQELAETDMEMVNLDAANFPDLDLDLLGIPDFEIVPTEILEPGCDEDEVPEHVEPKTKRGDIYQLGNHRLMCGDSTMVDDVEKLMNGEKADMVFTDPPYNIASDSKNFAKNVSKSMNDLANSEWDKDFKIEPALSTTMSVCNDSVTVYVWTSHFLFSNIINHLKEWCDFTGFCVWNKPNPMPSMSKRHWTWSAELCVYGTRGTQRIVNFPENGHESNVWTFVKKSDGSHPTQKPIELCEHPIKFSSSQGQNILDLFGGSGSTLIACEKTNRKCFMMEIDPHYCDVIVARWEKYTGKKAELLNGRQT